MFLTCEIRTVDGKSLSILVLKPKTFRSGKEGYHGQAKLTLPALSGAEGDGRRFQAQCQLAGIAAKSGAQPEPQQAGSGGSTRV